MEKEFKTLGERMDFLREEFDFKIPPKSYVIGMLDGRSFSKRWKNKLKKPFDRRFIEDMNLTAKYLCENIAGCKFAYVQSDEINLFLSDYENDKTQPWFDYRLCKMLSISAAMATGKFNQLRMIRYLREPNRWETFVDEEDEIYKQIKDGKELPKEEWCTTGTIYADMEDFKLSEFDSKFWSVPEKNDAVAWFIYRQNDCIRNSILQIGFTYFSHNQLKNLKTEEIKEKLLEERGIDWDEFNEGEKYGRIIVKENFDLDSGVSRNKWLSLSAPIFKEFDGKDWLNTIIPEKNT